MRFLVLIGSLVFFGCRASEETSRFQSQDNHAAIFDVNDVSILWPVPKDAAERALLPNLERASFLSEANFQTLLNLVNPKDDAEFAFTSRADWHVVGMRYDPCAKDLPSDETCRHELRLVVQPLTKHVVGAFVDHAMHLIYHLSPSQSKDVERRLLNLKSSDPAVSTNGQPLGVHPILREQGLSGSFAEGARKLLRDLAQEKDLGEATVMLNIQVTQWRFARSLMGSDGLLERAPIPFVATKTQTLFGDARLDGEGIFNEVRPLASGRDNVNDSVDSDGGTSHFYKLSAAEQGEAIQAALRIDNPLVHTPATVDCVSCHVATRILTRVKGPEYLEAQDGNPDRFPPPPGVTLKNITYADQLMHGYETRAFGYAIGGGRFPSMTQRTIQDSARVAGYLNAKMSGN